MATPITWQNVSGPSLAEASRPLDSAARAFDMGFGALNGVLQQRNRIADQNHLTGRENNTAAFQDAVAKYRTVDELKAAQASGVFDQLLSSLGPNIDNKAIRGAVDSRLTGLMTQQKQAGEFDNWQTDFNQAGERDAILADINSGDPARVAAGQQRLAASKLREKAALSLAGNNAAYQQVERGRAAEDQKWQGEAHRDGLLTSKNQREVSLGNLKVNQGQLGISERGMKVREAEAMSNLDMRLQEQEEKLQERYAATYSNKPGSAAGQKAIEGTLANIENEVDRKQARVMIRQAQEKYPNAPTSVLQQVARGIDADYAFDVFVRSGGVAAVGKAIDAGVGSEQEEQAQSARDRLQGLITAKQAQRSKLYGDAPVDTVAPTTEVASPFNMPEPVLAAPAPVVVSADSGGEGFGARLAFNQAQEQRQAQARLRTEAARKEFKAEEREKAQRALPQWENKVRALSNVSTPNKSQQTQLKQAEAQRDRLKALLQ